MNIPETLKQLIKEKNYPKFITYLHELYAMQYQAYTWNFNLFDLDFLSQVMVDAARVDDIRFLRALCVAAGGNNFNSIPNKDQIFLAAVEANTASVVTALLQEIDQVPRQGLSTQMGNELRARFTLNLIIHKIKSTYNLLSGLLANNDAEITGLLNQCNSFEPALLGQFIDDVTHQRRSNPFNQLQWQNFLRLVTPFNPSIVKEKLATYDYTKAQKIPQAIELAATEIVNTLQKATPTTPIIWEECVWFFKTPEAAVTSEQMDRFLNTKAFINKHNPRFALYLQDPTKIPNIGEVTLDVKQVQALFRAKCAQTMLASATTTKAAPNLKTYFIPGKTLQTKWDDLWKDLANWNSQITLGLRDASLLKQLLEFLLELDLKGIPYDLDPNKYMEGGKTPFLVAAFLQNPELMRLLIKLKNVDTNASSLLGETPLMLAAGKTAAIQLLVELPGLDLNATSSGSALHYATHADNAETVTLLLQRGVRLDLHDDSDYTALMLAISENKRAVIPILIANIPRVSSNQVAVSSTSEVMRTVSVDLNDLLRVFKKPGIQPATIALFIEHLILAQTGAKKLTGPANLYTLWETYRFDVNAVESTDGLTLLQRVCNSGYAPLMTELLKIESININIEDKKKWTALHYAIKGRYDDAALQILARNDVNINPEFSYLSLLDFVSQAAVLKKLMADPKFDVNCPVNDDQCFLSALIASHLYELAESIIIRPGIDVDRKIGQGKTPLETADLLLGNDPNPVVSNLFAKMVPLSKTNPLDYLDRFIKAAKRMDSVVLKALLAYPTVIENIPAQLHKLLIQLIKTNSYLYFLIQQLILAKTKEPKFTGSADLVSLFQHYQFDRNGFYGAQGQEGFCSYTLLHIACIQQKYRLVCDLLAIGADVNIVSSEGYSPIYYAIVHSLSTIRQDRRIFNNEIPFRLFEEKNLNVHPDKTLFNSYAPYFSWRFREDDHPSNF